MSGEKNKTGNVPNRLINEKSPYLLQHAENPVDWYPWCNEAFEKARTENKPVFLSIGYSTCHWCHVMARESFEDADVAGLLNDVFVCVKVDREERPDIDKVYMSACQMMTGSGGWPLTIVMTPDKQPFFAATYIPKESRFNRFGLMDIIPKIREVWIKQRDDVAKSAGQIVASLQRKGPELKGEAVSEKILDAAYNELAALYDEKHGGFGRAPKFPMPHQIIFLLRYWKWRGKNEALDMAAHTLRAMRYGGMYDHIGFGFHRYSTDEKWLVPHFEKMLYDQAMLAMAYTEAYQATGEDFFKRTACEIFTYVMRDMKSPSGGFYSAEDADTEGEEGKYYLWTDDEIEELMGPSDAELVTGVFRVEKGGNFVDPFAGGKTGHNILHMGKPASEIAHSLGISEESLHKRLSAARTKLFAAREGRTRPHKDDKILADWNGLMIAALAQGARVYANTAYLKAAQKAAKFVLKNMKDRNGRMFHRHRQGDSAITANLDDYAFLIWGLIECYEASFDASFLESALRLQENLMKHYWDKENGGYYFTPDDGEELILRQKEIYDGAIPSGNSVAMLNLVRLARITGKHEFEAQAAAVSAHFGNIIRNAPSNHGQFMIAVGFLTQPAHEIVIAGMPKAKDTKEMVQAIRRHYIPNTVVLLRPPDEASPEIVGIAPFTKDLISLDNRATAYVCSNFTCQRPTTDVVEMIGLLNIQEKAEWKK